MAFKYFLFVGIIGCALAQTEPSISDAIASLPPELQGKVNEKQVEEIKNKFSQVSKEKCAKNGGPEAYGNAENTVHYLLLRRPLPPLLHFGFVKEFVADPKVLMPPETFDIASRLL